MHLIKLHWRLLRKSSARQRQQAVAAVRHCTVHDSPWQPSATSTLAACSHHRSAAAAEGCAHSSCCVLRSMPPHTSRVLPPTGLCMV